MQVSNKLRLALEVIVELALKTENEKKVTVKELAEREASSKRYLEMIFADLKKANIVNSIKGFGGGYYLSKAASEITVAEIYNIFEGDFNLTEKNNDKEPISIDGTLDRKVWDPIALAVKKTVENITIEQLANSYKEEITNNYTYYI